VKADGGHAPLTWLVKRPAAGQLRPLRAGAVSARPEKALPASPSWMLKEESDTSMVRFKKAEMMCTIVRCVCALQHTFVAVAT